MEWSKYNTLFKSEKFGNLLYNSETNTFAELSDELFLQLDNIRQEKDNISSLNNNVKETLVRAKILDKNNNYLSYYKRFQYLLQNFSSDTLNLTIAPTTFCNFSCPYCYEENRIPVFMDEKIEEDLITFIKKNERTNKLSITWYGGEPLVGFNSIKRLMRRIEDEKIEIVSHGMITNGYLLDYRKSKFFTHHKLDFIQITLDGIQEVHDKRRILTGGGATFDKIISNIKIFQELNPSTSINIRVNLDKNNTDDYEKLYKYIKSIFPSPQINLVPAFVQSYTESCNKCDILNNKDKSLFYINLHKKGNVKIYSYPRLMASGCTATNINAYVVGPQGELYKCWNDVGAEEKIIGYINNDTIPNPEVLLEYMAGPSMFDDSECKDCNVSPICSGGCQWQRLANLKEKDRYDLCSIGKNHLIEFLEMHYENKKNGIFNSVSEEK